MGSPKRVIAPMVEQSDLVWRRLSRKYGAELCYTPMINARMFAEPKNEKFRQQIFSTDVQDRPLVVQFAANNPQELLRAARYVEDKCDAIDINLGCPQDIARKGRYGAYIQDEWDLIHDMISLLDQELAIPVTAKCRIFPTKVKTLDYAKMIVSAGASILTIHARTRDQKGQKTGLADWRYIQHLREHLPSDQVIFANGNVLYSSDIDRCIAETGCDGVMCAEGNLYNPAIFLNPSLPHELLFPRTDHIAQEYLSLVEDMNDDASMCAIKAHLFKILRPLLTHHHDVRNTLGTVRTLQGYKDIVKSASEYVATAMASQSDAIQQSDNFMYIVPYWRCQPYIRPLPV